MDIKVKNIGDGMKGINLDDWGGLEGFLRMTSTGSAGTTLPQMLRRVNPWLAKATDMTALAVAQLPFEIQTDSGEVFEQSSDWKNKLGGIPSPQDLFYNLASSLCLGKAYIIPRVTGRTIVDLHYCPPHTVTPLITTNGLQQFSRTSDYGQSGTYLPSPQQTEITGYTGEMMYFWLPDSDVEIGPARSYPAGAALMNAQLISSMANTIKTVSERGFVPPTILTAKGMPNPAEINKAEHWWNSFLRMWDVNVAKILNAEFASIVKVGAGMDELTGIYSELTKEQKESIGTAYGIPAALFMSDMAFASELEAMIKIWYSTSVFIKIYQTIADTFNSQILNRWGMRLKFLPNTLDAFQDDETKRSKAYADYIATGMRPSIAAQMLGLELPEGVEYDVLDEKYDSELKKPELEPAAAPVPQNDQQNVNLNADQIKDLDLWRQVAVRNQRKNKALPVDFICKHLSPELSDPIRDKLRAAKSEIDINKAFEIAPIGVKDTSGLFALAEAINRAADVVGNE